MFEGKNILITGGTGTFGRAFIEALIQSNTAFGEITIFSRDEHKQYILSKEINHPNIRYVIGDIRDEKAIQRASRGVDILIHAAALKQVGLAEQNTLEFIKTNVLGTQNVIDAAIENNIPKTIAISTDKACLPSGLYGASKLCAEKLLTSQSSIKNQFVVLRSGNVLGSRGSIVPVLLSAKDNIQLTDPEMTRFCMTTSSCFDFIYYALKEGKSGDIIIPKLPSFKLGDLARVLKPDSKIEITGLRLGEKKHEELIAAHESRFIFENEKFYTLSLTENPHAKVDFVYSSDKNSLWLSDADILNLCAN